jgi:hypothetical protein
VISSLFFTFLTLMFPYLVGLLCFRRFLLHKSLLLPCFSGSGDDRLVGDVAVMLVVLVDVVLVVVVVFVNEFSNIVLTLQ